MEWEKVSKTKSEEMREDIDLDWSTFLQNVVISGAEIEMVVSSKNLGVHLDIKLDWVLNKATLYKECQFQQKAQLLTLVHFYTSVM